MSYTKSPVVIYAFEPVTPITPEILPLVEKIELEITKLLAVEVPRGITIDEAAYVVLSLSKLFITLQLFKLK